MQYDVVIPTTGRACLTAMLASLSHASGPLPERVVIVDDRKTGMDLEMPENLGSLASRIIVLKSHARGPAEARNTGWQSCSSEWVSFLDDDIILTPQWREHLYHDVICLDDGVGASVGNIHVPLPDHRKHTDWERNVAGLAHAQWATADMTYRRTALIESGGFDPRFPYAYREDADLALRVVDAEWQISQGKRQILHPVRPAGRWISVSLQKGNASNALMRHTHGAGWRQRCNAGPGRLLQHSLATAALLFAALAPKRWLRVASTAIWCSSTASFIYRRLHGGLIDRREVITIALTSAVIPPLAVGHRLKGELAVRTKLKRRPARRAILFDRDGTLVVDVPYNGSPEAVQLVDGAREAVRLARRAGFALGVVTNQSGVGRGMISRTDVVAVNKKIDRLIGPFDHWAVCPHTPETGCTCRKPNPGLILQASRALGIPPSQCTVIGDIGSDIQAATVAGAQSILVPAPVTLPEEIAAAPNVASTLFEAVRQTISQQTIYKRTMNGRETATEKDASCQ